MLLAVFQCLTSYYPAFIDKLRANIVCMQAGAPTVPLTSDKTTIARTARRRRGSLESGGRRRYCKRADV